MNFKIIKNFLVSILLIASFSCQKEAVIDETISSADISSDEILIDRLEFDDFEELNQLYFETVLSQTKGLKSSSSTKGYDFEIDKTQVTHFSVKGSSYYTMSLLSEEDETHSFYNVVVCDYVDKDPEAFLLGYFPDEAYIEGLETKKTTHFTGTTTVQNLDYQKLITSGGCYQVVVPMCRQGGKGHPRGSDCTPAYFYEDVRTECPIGGLDPSGGGDVDWGYNDDDGNNDGPRGSSGSSGGADIITEPISRDNNVGAPNKVVTHLGITDGVQVHYLWANALIARDILDFLEKNSYLKNAKELGKFIVETKAVNVNTNRVIDYESSLKKMAEGLRKFHGNEGAMFADLIEGVVKDFSLFTVGEVKDFHQLAKDITISYNNSMLYSVSMAFVEGAIIPTLELALFEMGGTVAIKILQRIPASWSRGMYLNSMVQGVTRLGIRGTSNNIRIIQTKNPLTNAREIFRAMTKNKISSTTNAEGTIVANMGNNNFITFRTVSSSGFDATVSFNFQKLLNSNNFVLKFSKL